MKDILLSGLRFFLALVALLAVVVLGTVVAPMPAQWCAANGHPVLQGVYTIGMMVLFAYGFCCLFAWMLEST
jgi:hypothetical protein